MGRAGFPMINGVGVYSGACNFVFICWVLGDCDVQHC